MSISIPVGNSATASGLSGMRAAQRNLDTSAHNVANLQTPGFKRQTVEQSAQANLGGVTTTVHQNPNGTAGGPGGDGFAHLADDLVNQRVSLYSLAANLKTVETEHQMLGSLLDTEA